MDLAKVDLAVEDLAAAHLVLQRANDHRKRVGLVINHQDVKAALRDGRLRGAGVDVFDHEPPLDSPLLTAPNVVLSPHAGAYSDEAMIAANLLAAQLVVRKMRGERLPEECVVAP